MSLREKRILMIASVAVLLFLGDLIILGPFTEGRTALLGQIKKEKQDRDQGRWTVEREDEIREAWKAHRFSEPEGTSDDLAASFQEDFLGIFKKARIQTDTLVKRAEVDLRNPKGLKEITFSASFSGDNDDLVELKEALDAYDGYLRVNWMQINAQKDKRQEILDVKLEVSTIWFKAGNGVRS